MVRGDVGDVSLSLLKGYGSHPLLLFSVSPFSSNSPFTCLTTSLESENMFVNFPPSFWIIDIPSNMPHTLLRYSW